MGLYVWTENEDEGKWSDPFPTHKEAIASGFAEAILNEWTTFYTMEVEHFTRSDFNLAGIGEEAITRVRNCMEELGGDEGNEDWPEDSISIDEETELDGRLIPVILSFLEEKGALPTKFYKVRPSSIKTHEVPIQIKEEDSE